MISIIAAMAKNRVIGRDNEMPWHLPADLAHFKQLTWGKPIVMGRKTFESIGRPLPGRENFVISSNQHFKPEGCVVLSSIDEALKQLALEPEVMIIGGSTLYTQCIERADKMYLTRILRTIKGDTYFPEFSEDEWTQVDIDAHQRDEKNPYDYEFVTLVREAKKR
jgi:dihydrofolate reductase